MQNDERHSMKSKSILGGHVEIIGPDAASIEAVAKHIETTITAKADKVLPLASEMAEEPDKATARPWHNYNKTDGAFVNDAIGKEVCRIDSRYRPTLESHANAALIVTAVNEHAALLAVAEACQAIEEAKSTATDDALTCFEGRLEKAFDRLAAVRKAVSP